VHVNDGIQRLARAVEERLYSAMEDFALDVMIGKGPSARALRLSLPPFTVVGATTRVGALTAPLRDRFGAIYRMEYYDPAALKQILIRSARILKVHADEAGIEEIAGRARGTPRIVNRLLKRVRDYAQVRADGVITLDVAKAALDGLEIDHIGLEQTDRNLLLTIIQKFDGGPVGLDTLAASTSEDPETIEDVYEPYLLQLGFSALEIGAIVTATLIGTALLTLWVGLIANRYSRRRLLLAAALLIPAVVTIFMPLFWFVAKTGVLLFVFIWIRGTLPRFRYDQLMNFAWNRPSSTWQPSGRTSSSSAMLNAAKPALSAPGCAASSAITRRKKRNSL